MQLQRNDGDDNDTVEAARHYVNASEANVQMLILLKCISLLISAFDEVEANCMPVKSS